MGGRGDGEEGDWGVTRGVRGRSRRCRDRIIAFAQLVFRVLGSATYQDKPQAGRHISDGAAESTSNRLS